MDVDIASLALRALSFVAMWQAAGMALFTALFHSHLDASLPRIRRVGLYSALTAMLLVAAHHCLEAARRSGDFSSLWDAALQKEVLYSSVGAANLLRVIALSLVATGFMSATVRRSAISMLGVLALPAAFLLTGHTSVHPLRWILAPLLATHLMVVTFWFGALSGLLIATYRESAATVAALTVSFTGVATWLVPLIAVSGIVMASMLLPNLNALRQPYGLLLLAKLGGFVALMALAALNKWRLAPRIATGTLSSMTAFRRSLMAEYVLVVGVMVVTATLTSLFSPES
jgi:putative copper export protein